MSTASPSPRAVPGLDEHEAEARIEARIALPEEMGD